MIILAALPLGCAIPRDDELEVWQELQIRMIVDCGGRSEHDHQNEPVQKMILLCDISLAYCGTRRW